MITKGQLRIKRCFDILLSFILLALLALPILVLIIAAAIDTKDTGIYVQTRVGQYGELFKIYKIRTLKGNKVGPLNSIEPISSFAKFLRRFKLNELPQLVNVLIGDMSFVGPRPDLPGFADQLKGKDRIILSIKPGITGPATLKYRDESSVLERQKDPEEYNRTIIWEDKVKINKNYIENYSFSLDLELLIKTIINK